MCVAAWQPGSKTLVSSGRTSEVLPVAGDACPAAMLGTTPFFVMRLQVRTEAEARVQQLRTAQDEEQQLTAQEKRKVRPGQLAYAFRRI